MKDRNKIKGKDIESKSVREIERKGMGGRNERRE